MASRDLVHAAFMARFPIDAPRATVEYLDTLDLGSTKLGIVLRLVVRDANNEVRDIKEQELVFDHDAEWARLDAFLAALVKLVGRVLATTDLTPVMPHDLVVFSPLGLAKAQTEADFEKALSARSRLGPYLVG